jgi:hypothetical protein
MVDSLDEAREDVFQRVVDNWTLTSYLFQDEEDEDGLEEGTASWIRVSVTELDSEKVNLGAVGSNDVRYKRTCLLSMQVFTLPNAGSNESATIAETGRTLFEGAAFNGIDFLEGIRIIDYGLEPDDRWKQTNVEGQFVYEITR